MAVAAGAAAGCRREGLIWTAVDRISRHAGALQAPAVSGRKIIDTSKFGEQVARLLTAVAVTIGLSACDGPRHPLPPIELTATSTDANAPATRGEDVGFTVTVANPSSHDVQEVTIFLINDLSTQLRSATCHAQGGVVCPSGSSGAWEVPTMPAGSSLTFELTTTVMFSAQGTFSSQVSVFAKNRSTSADAIGHGTVVADARSGSYEMYSTSGRLSTATLDFMANTFAPGDGSSLPFSLQADGYQLSGNAKFDTSPDLVVGNFDAGSGPEPFIAARRFVSTLAELDGASFNSFTTRYVNGNRRSMVMATWFAGAMMTSCVDDTVFSAASCPAGSQRHYSLTVADGVFTGVDAEHGETVSFRVAKSNDSLVLLRAGLGADFHGLQVGLLAGAVPAEFNGMGGNTGGDWGGAQTTPTRFDATWTGVNGQTRSDSAVLSQVTGANPGLLQGQRSSDGSLMYFAADGLLGVVVAGPTSPANGEMQVLFLPYWP